MSKKKATTPKQSRDVALCKRLGIDPKRLLEPAVQKAIGEHWRKVREALTEPIDIPVEFKNPPGAVQGSRVNNRVCKARVIPDSHGVR